MRPGADLDVPPLLIQLTGAVVGGLQAQDRYVRDGAVADAQIGSGMVPWAAMEGRLADATQSPLLV